MEVHLKSHHMGSNINSWGKFYNAEFSIINKENIMLNIAIVSDHDTKSIANSQSIAE